MTALDGRERVQEQAPDSSLLVFQAGADFRAALQRFARATEEICQRHGLTGDQFKLLLMIKGARDGTMTTTVTELAERMALAQNGVTERVRRAELTGLLERQPALHDRRFKSVRLTELGDTLLSNAFSDLGEESTRLMAYISDVGKLAQRLGSSRGKS